MIPILIYWTLQIAIWITCVFIFVRRKEVAERHNGGRDSIGKKALLLLLTPVLAFAYACLGGYPPRGDQVYLILFVTLFMYGALFARWVRQNRKQPNDP